MYQHVLYSVSMDALQHVTAMKIMSLRSQETLNGRKEFIVISTITTHGEDLNSKGNVSDEKAILYILILVTNI